MFPNNVSKLPGNTEIAHRKDVAYYSKMLGYNVEAKISKVRAIQDDSPDIGAKPKAIKDKMGAFVSDEEQLSDFSDDTEPGNASDDDVGPPVLAIEDVTDADNKEGAASKPPVVKQERKTRTSRDEGYKWGPFTFVRQTEVGGDRETFIWRASCPFHNDDKEAGGLECKRTLTFRDPKADVATQLRLKNWCLMGRTKAHARKPRESSHVWCPWKDVPQLQDLELTHKMRDALLDWGGGKGNPWVQVGAPPAPKPKAKAKAKAKSKPSKSNSSSSSSDSSSSSSDSPSD